MSKITTIDTPLGALGITSNGEALTAITFSEEIEDLSGNQVDASEDPILAATEARARAFFAGELKSFDLPLSMSGTAFQHRGVGGAARDPVRRDGFLRQGRRSDRAGASPLESSGRACQWGQSDPDCRALPSSHRS